MAGSKITTPGPKSGGSAGCADAGALDSAIRNAGSERNRDVGRNMAMLLLWRMGVGRDDYARTDAAHGSVRRADLGAGAGWVAERRTGGRSRPAGASAIVGA